MILFAVALGDAAVVAIDLAGDAAAGSFHSSMETLAGKDDFEVTAAGGLPEALVARIARLPYALRVSPRIEDHATGARPTGRDIRCTPDRPVDRSRRGCRGKQRRHPHRQDATADARHFEHINDPDAVWVTRGLGKAVGDRIQLLINDHAREYVVRGLIPDSAQMGTDAILMDIGAAQLATGKSGRVDRILIKAPDCKQFRTVAEQAAAGAACGRAAQCPGNGDRRQSAHAGGFPLESCACSAASRCWWEPFSFTTPSPFPWCAGAPISAPCAPWAQAAVQSWVHFCWRPRSLAPRVPWLPCPWAACSPREPWACFPPPSMRSMSPAAQAPWRISAGSVLLALVAGIGVALASALAPAREASMVPPTEAMARGRREFEVRVERKRDAGLRWCWRCWARWPRRPRRSRASLCWGTCRPCSLSRPPRCSRRWWCTAPPSARGRADFAALLGVEALLASRSLGGSLRRTSVLVAALATAIAMMTSVGIMVGSFRQTVLTWLDSELPADLYLAPAGAMGGDLHPTIAPEVADRIAATPGVESVSRLRAYEIQYQGLPASLAGASQGRSAPRQNLTFLSRRPSADILRELAAGNNAVVSEPFANKHHVKAGDTITLPLGEQRVTFRVIDIFYDYGHEAGYIVLDWSTLLRYLPDSAPTNLAVYLAPGADLERTRAAIQKAIANKSLMMLSNGEIRQQAIRVFDQTFAITYAVEAISILVAIGGIAGALISIVMDRRREFGVLRYLGGTSAQIRKLILVEAGLIGLLANVLGLVLGYVLSLVLVYVINKQSFGWTIQFHWPVAVLLGSLSVVYVATVLAGLFPARLAVRLDPMEVVHEE